MGRTAQRMRRGNVYKNLVMRRGPVSFPSLAVARQYLNAPADANYVMWNPTWPVNRDLEDVFALELAANDILVLPERPEPYIIDSSEGFRASGVQSVTGRYGELPIVNRYKGIRSARTWFAMARARRGIIGLGPGAVIQLGQSSWTQEPQIEDKGSVQPDGWTSPGRFWTNTSGVLKHELIGCQEKIIEAEHASPYFGNFSLRAHSLGGVAFGAIVGANGTGLRTFEHLDLSNGWRGFLGLPNGEAGAVAATNGTYKISRCIFGTRDETGTRVATSPIMVNASTGGLIEETDAVEAYRGMLTIWNSSGLHTLRNVNARFNTGLGINLEKCQSGFQLEWVGGSLWSDYAGKGSKTPRPADQPVNGGGLHIGLFSEVGSAIINLRGVDLDTGPQAGALCVQSYGASQQNVADIHCYDKNGATVPVKLYA